MPVTTNSTVFAVHNNTGFSLETSNSFTVWFLSFLLVFTAPGNVLIIHLLSHQKKTVSTSGFTTFAISLAVTDTVVGLVILPISLIRSVIQHWSSNEFSCLLFGIIDFGMASVSVITMAAMGYDRHKCVTSPISYRVKFKQHRIVLTSVIIWFLVIGAWVPGMTILHLRNDIDRASVMCSVQGFGYLAIPHALILYTFPLSLTVMTYTKLVLNLRKRFHFKSSNAGKEPYTISGNDHRRNQCPGSLQTNSDTPTWSTHYQTNRPDYLSDSVGNSTTGSIFKPKHEIRASRNYQIAPAECVPPGLNSQNIKCFKTSILVVLCFVLCWGPLCLLWPVVQVCKDCVNVDIYYISVIFSYANSTINPFIYLVTSVQLRQDFKKLIWRR